MSSPTPPRDLIMPAGLQRGLVAVLAWLFVRTTEGRLIPDAASARRW